MLRQRLWSLLLNERGIGEYVALGVSLLFLLVVFSITTAFYGAWSTESKLQQAARYVLEGEQEYGGYTMAMQSGLIQFCQQNGLDPKLLVVRVNTSAAQYGSQVEASLGYDYRFIFAGLEAPWIKYLSASETGFSQWIPGVLPDTGLVAPTGFSGLPGENTTLVFRV